MMPRARLQTDPARHHAVGHDLYAPVTQPFERYSDLLMQQQIMGHVLHSRALYAKDDLDKALLHTSFARTAAREIVDGSRRYWLLKYLEAQTGSDADAVVLETFGAGCLVLLEDTLLTAFCPTTGLSTPAPGAHVRVRLAKASARGDVLRLRLV